MKILPFARWYAARPRIVRHVVRATIFRFPATEVIKPDQHYIDSGNIRVAGVLRQTRYLVLGAPDREAALSAVCEAANVREWQEVVQVPRRLKKGLDVRRSDVIVWRESVV